jgi:hypothetical protein
MNTTDMYSRERTSQAHLADIQHATRDARLLRTLPREKPLAEPPAARQGRGRLILAGAMAAIFIVALAALVAVSMHAGITGLFL